MAFECKMSALVVGSRAQCRLTEVRGSVPRDLTQAAACTAHGRAAGACGITASVCRMPSRLHRWVRQRPRTGGMIARSSARPFSFSISIASVFFDGPRFLSQHQKLRICDLRARGDVRRVGVANGRPKPRQNVVSGFPRNRHAPTTAGRFVAVLVYGLPSQAA